MPTWSRASPGQPRYPAQRGRLSSAARLPYSGAVTIIDVDQAVAPAFGLADDLAPFQSEWHAHTRHQILYSVRGALQLQVQDGSGFCPASRGLSARKHRPSRGGRAAIALDVPYTSHRRCCRHPRGLPVFTVTPLLRELLLYATRFRHDSPADDPLLLLYFVRCRS